jgi:hypothetical protein
MQTQVFLSTMAYPPSYYPIANKAMFFHVNWTWAPPGTRGNVCELCGSHCFCAAKAGLLPKTRSGSMSASVEQPVRLAVEQPVQQAVQDSLELILQYDSD